MDGMDDEVVLDGKKFDMSCIDVWQKVGDVVIWEICNINSIENGMVYLFYVYGIQFRVLVWNDGLVYFNEYGLKDMVGVNFGEMVWIKVKFELIGVYMYYCYIIEYEDGGMMV